MSLAALAADQNGLITRSQASGAGISDGAIRHAIAPGGRWQRVLPGVYATFTGPLTMRHRLTALVLAAGEGACVSAVAACRVHGLRYLPPTAPTVVLVPAERRVVLPSTVRVVRTRRLPAALVRDGIAVAPVERAVVDACVLMGSLRDVRALTCESVQRGMTTVARLEAEVMASPVRGSRRARQALDDLALGARSAPECDLLDLLRQSSVVPMPQMNVALPGLAGVIPDAWWRQARLVLEVDSAEHHAYGPAAEATQRRHALMAAAGWTVLPISPRRLRDDPSGVLRDIESAYLAALARQG